MCINVTICVTFYYIITQKTQDRKFKTYNKKTSLPYFDKEVTHVYAVLTFLFSSRSIISCFVTIGYFLNAREPRKPAKPPTIAITTP